MKKIIDVKFKDLQDEFAKFGKSVQFSSGKDSDLNDENGKNTSSGGSGSNGGDGFTHKNRKAFKLIFPICIIVILIFGVSTSLYSVDQTEYVILTTFGVPSHNIQEPGLRFKLPFGIQNIIRIPKRTSSIALGYTQSGQEITRVDEEETKMITGDENIILADIEVQWRVVDPIAFVYNNDKPEVVLTNAVSASLRNIIGNSTVDDALTDGRNEIIEKIKNQLITLTSSYNLGISIVNVNLQDIDLPTKEVDTAFKSVTDAREERITKVNEANKYKNEKINEVIGKESAILSNANAQKTVLIEKAKGEVAKFNSLYAEYQKNPQVTKKDLIINTLKDVYSNAKIMISDGNTFKYLSIEEMIKGGKK